jgi:hypothetical protein
MYLTYWGPGTPFGWILNIQGSPGYGEFLCMYAAPVVGPDVSPVGLTFTPYNGGMGYACWPWAGPASFVMTTGTPP